MWPGRTQQQVLGWIGREGEFGKDDNIGPAAQAFGTIDDAPGIAGNIPDQQIDLRQCKPLSSPGDGLLGMFCLNGRKVIAACLDAEDPWRTAAGAQRLHQ